MYFDMLRESFPEGVKEDIVSRGCCFRDFIQSKNANIGS